MRATRAALAALGLAALLAGCAMPPYSEELSLAQVTRAKLGTPVFKVGPVFSRLDDSASRDRYYFLPNRDDPLSYGGFLIRESDYGLWLWFVGPYSSNTDLGNNSFMPVDNTSKTANNYLLQPIAASVAGTSFLSLTRFASAYNNVVLISATGPSTVTQGVAPSLPTELGLTNALGANIFADSTNGSDPQFFLGSLGLGLYQEYECATSSASAFSYLGSSGSSDLGLVPDGVKNGFYAHNPVLNLSYLSIPSGSSYVTYSWAWAGAGAAAYSFQQLAGVKGRVEAVLTNGQLLAFADNTYTLYGPTGAKLNEFPLGGLKFCYELTDGTAGTVYFSLAYWLWGRDEKSDQLYVEMYAIPTDQLRNL